jgi:Zn ribbon nucleic-acid-binding protein
MKEVERHYCRKCQEYREFKIKYDKTIEAMECKQCGVLELKVELDRWDEIRRVRS